MEEQDAFQHLKEALCTNEVLAHFGSSQEIGISCNVSNIGSWSGSLSLLPRWKQTSTCQCFQDTDKHPAALQPDSDGSSCSGLCAEEVSPVSVWMMLYFGDRSQAPGCHVWTHVRYFCDGGKLTCMMGTSTESV